MAEPEKPTTGAGGAGAAPAGGRWKTWALVVSLGLNLFVAAAVLGAGLRHHREGRDVGFGPYTEALSREDRAALRDAFMAAAPDLRDRRRAMAEDMARLAAALRAEPWDPAVAEAVLSQQGERAEERFALGRRLFLERLGGMTPDARTALADRIEHGMARGRD
ncbi:periplasmic heavy metal sensor [Albidovulum sp.]|uniref:periplasmic heavy metal sensor n=1 Tax=Albidovulum sp. TaxID=1872424 RepID=UPI0039B9B830